jgi:UDP-N-acetylmuramyl tripeptide synthase
MKITRARAYVGPNVIAATPLVHLIVDPEGAEDWPGTSPAGAPSAALLRLLPGLGDHADRGGRAGSFAGELRSSAALPRAYVAARIAAELQRGAGEIVKPAGARRRADGRWDLFFGYDDPDIGLRAGQAAVQLALSLLPPADATTSGRVLAAFRRRAEALALDPTTRALLAEAARRDIPWFVLDRAAGIVQLGQGHRLRRLRGSVTDATPALATWLQRDRSAIHRIFAELQLPVPPQARVQQADAAVQAAERLGYPVAVKPALTGRGASCLDLKDAAAVRAAFEHARQAGPNVIVERHVDGNRYRAFCVGGALIAVTQQPGGAAELPAALDVTASLHPDNRCMLAYAARVAGLEVVGIDFVTPDVAQSYRDVASALCAVDTAPALPPTRSDGEPARGAAAAVIDRLFPPGDSGRIPIAAVTGTNGKTTTSRMLTHILRHAGEEIGVRVVGRATTEGVHVGDSLIAKGDYAGGVGARLLLRDPAVEAAVLETARGGLVKIGMAVAWCEVGAVLNVADDHLGLHGLETLEDMAAIKECVAQAARKLAVLNADDPRCLAMAALKEPDQTCLFTLRPLDEGLRAELGRGCLVIGLEEADGTETICLRRGDAVDPVIAAARIPATLNGAARHNVQNAMAAVGLAYGLGVSIPRIAESLAAFRGDHADNPGRLNVFEGYPFKVVHDSAHNPHGMRVLCEALRHIPASGRRICVVTGIGVRHGEHIQEVAEIIAREFDVFICSRREKIRLVSEVTRDFPLEEVPQRLAAALAGQGVDPARIVTIDLDTEAVDRGLATAREGDLLVLLTGMVDWTWDRLMAFGETAADARRRPA